MKRVSYRHKKVGSRMHHILAELFMGSLKDPALSLVSVLDVVMTKDLKLAKIYYSLPSGTDEATADKVVEGLRRAAGFIRRHVGQELGIKYTPELVFHRDTTLDHAMHINELLKEITPEDEQVSPAIAAVADDDPEDDEDEDDGDNDDEDDDDDEDVLDDEDAVDDTLDDEDALDDEGDPSSVR